MLLKFYRHTLVRMLNESAQLIVIITTYGLALRILLTK